MATKRTVRLRELDDEESMREVEVVEREQVNAFTVHTALPSSTMITLMVSQERAGEYGGSPRWLCSLRHR